MNAAIAIDVLLNKYSTDIKNSDLSELEKNLYLPVIIDFLKTISEFISDEERYISIDSAIKLMQLTSTIYVNHLKLSIESYFDEDKVSKDNLFRILYTPQIIFYNDFFNFVMDDEEESKKSAMYFNEMSWWLSDNSIGLDKNHELSFLLEKIGLNKFLTYDDADYIHKISCLRSFNSDLYFHLEKPKSKADED
ncbi:hypothetical protein [Providencia rettgeri]|uniref:hypothetical protein n=1 Tax=Providencia rettgeri TaxID=587 RepID=UPI00236019F0|nr:hypothetical protein [Providencia rettgeri]